MELIFFDNRQDKVEITDDILEVLKEVINLALEIEGINFPVEVSISFVNNNEIQQLNNEFRGINSATDVLSFPLIERGLLERLKENSKLETDLLLGDIIISASKVVEQSKEFDHSFLRECAYLTAHGIFHLLGYDHVSPKEKAIMREREESVMGRLKIFRN